MMQFALNPHRATMVLHDVLHDGQPKTGATRFSRAGRIHPIEPLEEARMVLIGNALSEVADEEFDALAGRPCSELDLSARLAVLQCILDQVPEDLLDSVAVTAHNFVGAIG